VAGHQRTADTPAGGGRADTPAGGGQAGAMQVLRMGINSYVAGEGRTRRKPRRGGREDVSTFAFHLLIARCCIVLCLYRCRAVLCCAVLCCAALRIALRHYCKSVLRALGRGGWSYSRACTAPAPELQRHRTDIIQNITDIAHLPHPHRTVLPWALRFTNTKVFHSAAPCACYLLVYYTVPPPVHTPRM
jgi:hypothetical protein